MLKLKHLFSLLVLKIEQLAKCSISRQKFITVSFWEQLLHVKFDSHHTRTTLLPYNQCDSFVQAEPFRLECHLIKQYVTVFLISLMYWCLFHCSRLHFTELFNRRILSSYLVNKYPPSAYLGTIILISCYKSHLPTKVKKAVTISCLWYDWSQAHQESGRLSLDLFAFCIFFPQTKKLKCWDKWIILGHEKVMVTLRIIKRFDCCSHTRKRSFLNLSHWVPRCMTY